MKYRKLRIAWSVAWGLVAVLLCVLWVRSYWWRDSIWRMGTNSIYTDIVSNSGTLALFKNDRSNAHNVWLLVEMDRWNYANEPATKHLPGFEWRSGPGEFYMRSPHWLVSLAFALSASVPWFTWRFSLRTLLIATTLVALVLGAIVYAVR